jgi:arylsulfatase A-like enzyme
VVASSHRRRQRFAIPLAIILIGVTAWRMRVPTTLRTAGGIVVGHLPAGVRLSDLNVLLVTLDTTRADRIGAYGFRGIETPWLDRLAREGVVFGQAASSAPLTLPAHSSLFTGRLPAQHGVRENGMVLRSSEITLATVLKAHGFQTAAVTGSFVVASQWGLNRGFDVYLDAVAGDRTDQPGRRAPHRKANEVADRALDWLQQHEASRFFAWLHFYDAHAPYDPPEPYRTTYSAHPYLGEIAFVDEQLGRVLAFLEARGSLDRTIVVVIGDHGESLGEHGERTHGLFVYESVMRVPFIIRTPFTRLQGRRVDEPTRSIDMMPTVLDLLGISSPAGVRGRSVAALMTGAERGWDLETYSESMYPRDYFGWSELRASRLGRFKVILAPRPELYDLVADPAESRNVYTEHRVLADRMAARVRAIERALADTGPEPPALPADHEVRDRLASLGYVAAISRAVVADEAALPDPKDQIELYNRIIGARRDFEATGGLAYPRRVTR